VVLGLCCRDYALGQDVGFANSPALEPPGETNFTKLAGAHRPGNLGQRQQSTYIGEI
jgi:hypothetical protein